MSTLTEKNYERIWLEPRDGADPYIGRQWCSENQWGEGGVEYVRADLVPAPAGHSVSVEAVGDPEAWLFHETSPHRPQTIYPRWMSINQINKHIAALEGELRARAALSPDTTPQHDQEDGR